MFFQIQHAKLNPQCQPFLETLFAPNTFQRSQYLTQFHDQSVNTQNSIPSKRALRRSLAYSTNQEPTNQQPTEQNQKKTLSITASLARSISYIGKDRWDACHDGINPFISYDFLNALEESKSVHPDTGWLPQHLILTNKATEEILGCMPLYLKSHSYGEYVFDHAWAEAYDSFVPGGGDGTINSYYPKLQSCVPFTPVTGTRLLIKKSDFEKEVLKAMAETLSSIPIEMKVSSLHITFNTIEEWNLLSTYGFAKRAGIQYHWTNGRINNNNNNNNNEIELFTSFDDFLASLQQKRRKSIRQERKKIANLENLTIKRLTGDELKDQSLWDSFYDFYLDTVDRKLAVPYLTREFFSLLSETMSDKMMLVVAYDVSADTTKNGKIMPIAAALNFISGTECLFGRNWGCAEMYKGLHFELCYYQAIEFAIEKKIRRVEAGAQGEHKLQRGYLPNLTFSSHFIVDDGFRSAVESFLRRERAEIAAYAEILEIQASPYKS